MAAIENNEDDESAFVLVLSVGIVALVGASAIVILCCKSAQPKESNVCLGK